MRRTVALRLLAALGTAAVGGAVAVALPMSEASAATGGVTGYATQNGGTTGGAGGQTVRATTGTAIHAALCGRASSSTPIIIEVQGTINHGNTTKVSGASCNTAADKIELKEISNVTIVGVGGGAVFDQLGIHIRDSSNIIIQNVTVRNVKKSGSPTSNGGDAIGMESTVRNVWVDHATLEASGGESEGFDGLFDMKDNTQYVTLSYSILRNSGRGGLIGSSESDRSNSFITFHHNSYENLDSRTPLLRGGVAHIYNNSYVSLNESGINSRAGARAKVENNYFKNSKDVLGTFYTSEAGFWQVSGNVFDNVTWSAPGSENNPAGPNPQSNTTVSIPYAYTLDGASCVPAIVSQTAGANKGLQVSNGNCSPQQPTPTTPGPASPTPTTPGPTTPPRLGRLQQGQRYGLRQRPRRRPGHVLVPGRRDRLHLDQVGLRDHGVPHQHPRGVGLGRQHRLLAGHQPRHRRRAGLGQRGRRDQLRRDVADQDHVQHHELDRYAQGRRVRDVRRLRPVVHR
jgi:pectate lyase